MPYWQWTVFDTTILPNVQYLSWEAPVLNNSFEYGSCWLCCFSQFWNYYDTVNRKFFSLLLSKFNFFTNASTWMESYLNSSKQCTRINETCSSCTDCNIDNSTIDPWSTYLIGLQAGQQAGATKLHPLYSLYKQSVKILDKKPRSDHHSTGIQRYNLLTSVFFVSQICIWCVN